VAGRGKGKEGRERGVEEGERRRAAGCRGREGEGRLMRSWNRAADWLRSALSTIRVRNSSDLANKS